MDQQMLMMMPGLTPEELLVIQSITREMTDTQQQQFFTFYQSKRKQQQSMLLYTLIGFLGIAGIQRFIVGETLMGILYLVTAGFCGIGTIIDLVNIKSITADYNQKQAMETASLVRMINA